MYLIKEFNKTDILFMDLTVKIRINQIFNN